MEYRKFNNTYYVRMDKGDEIIGKLLSLCRKEGIASAVFSGIGGCSEAAIQTFIPANGSFETRRISGMLELVALNGNVITDDNGQLYQHTHAAFAYKDGETHTMAGGHIKAITVLYTAEIELRPVADGCIKRRYNEETGTGFWHFEA